MAAKKVDQIELIKILSGLDKGYFTFADLERVIGLKSQSLKVAISRLVKKGVLTRIKRGIYQLAFNPVDVKKIANQLYYPSYLSFESALSQYGILSQIPYVQTFATPKKSKKIVLWKTEVQYRQLNSELYWGYTLENGIYLAEPEKAILDQLYFVSRGKTTLKINELNLVGIDKEKLRQYAKKFPGYVQPLVNNLIS